MPQRRKQPLFDPLEQLVQAQKSERAKLYASRPKRVADVVSQVIARRGYARVRSGDALLAAWQQAAGEVPARQSRAARVQRGTLEVIVVNSTLMQELTFSYATLLAEMQRLLPDEQIRKLRFKIGSLG